jgi:putative ABC transport system permease protein
VKALTRKLRRDLVRLGGQAVSIALVVASGVASYITLASASASLQQGRERYYETNRFPHLFAHLKRAPLALRESLERIPGVALLEVREVEAVNLPLATLDEPAVGRLISLPSTGQPRFNALHVVEGRLPERSHGDEVALLESFARAHALLPGSRIPVLFNGIQKDVSVSGLVMSPEFIFGMGAMEPMPDPARFAVLWMPKEAMAPVFQMDGAFNDLVASLERGTAEEPVIKALDAALDPFGGFGTLGRAYQISHRFLSSELDNLDNSAGFLATIFLGVAVFLLQVLLGRLVQLHRTIIGTLRALGYSASAIASHYLSMLIAIVVVGNAMGIALGAVLGKATMSLYEPFFRYPRFDYVLPPEVVVTSVLGSLVVSSLAVSWRLWQASSMVPAEALSPEQPPLYGRQPFANWLRRPSIPTSVRMMMREVGRRPLRTAVSIVGVALATAILVGSRFGFDAVDEVIALEFELAQQADLTVTFHQTMPQAIGQSLASLPGVVQVELGRTVPARLQFQQRERIVPVTAFPSEPRLRHVVQFPGGIVTPPAHGILLPDTLAAALGAQVGDIVSLFPLEGTRPRLRLSVEGIATELMGLQAQVNANHLHGLLGEVEGINAAYLRVDPTQRKEVKARLKQMPQVASVVERQATIDRFRRQSGGTIVVTTLVLVLFAATIASGVVYNQARIALSLRHRDLASLRVLGFTQGEVAWILLGELGFQVLVAIPLGLALGKALVWLLTVTSHAEIFRLPTVVSSRTYAFAATITLLASLVSALAMGKKLREMDLLGVLKSRD